MAQTYTEEQARQLGHGFPPRLSVRQPVPPRHKAPVPPAGGRASPLISPTQRQYVDAVLDVWETVILPFCEFFVDPSLLSASAPSDPLARFRLSQ